MKKLVVILVAVLVLFGVFMAWNQKNNQPAVSTPAPEADAAAVQTPAAQDLQTPAADAPQEIPEVRGLDYDAIRALYPEDQTAVTVAGESLDWGLYADWLHMEGTQFEEYFRQMAEYYGLAAGWTGSVGDGSGMNYAQYLLSETNETLSSFLAIRSFAKENGVELSEEERASLEPEAIAAQVCGEGATVEQLREKLENESHMSIDAFRYYSESVQLYGDCYRALYGENGEKISEADAVKYLEDQGYLSAGHILFMTIDPNTGDALDEAAVAAKKEQADAIVEELRAIEDHEELAKRFLELKAQYCEDGGKVAYPDGYTFTPGTMVAEFEAAVKNLEEYGVSEPVKSNYGYHVILRLPLRADSPLFSLQGQPGDARREMSQAGITEKLDAFYEANPAEYAEGIKTLDLTAYIK